MTEEIPQEEGFRLAGDRLGKFVILSELGRGSMGVVYEAFQEDLKRKVALKILPANITLDPKQVRRFHREAESVARLRHDNVIQIYEVGEVGQTHYFAMELVEGRPLSEQFGRDRDSILRAARIAAQAARGLAHAHERGVIHRDIKPGNLLVDRSGRVVVTDFGLARLTDSASLTSTDAIVGTPKYMSPEQILPRAGQPLDGRTDVYSLGATLFHIVAGRPPFEAPSVQAFIKAILEERAPSPRRFNKQIPHDLATIIRRCLEKDPADRYANAGELADDLERFLAGERIHAKPKGALALAVETVRRHRIVAALSVIAALAVTVGLVYGGKAAEEGRRAEFEAELRDASQADDPDMAILLIEKLRAEHPNDPAVEELGRRLYYERALHTLQGRELDPNEVLPDIEKSGRQNTFWYPMLLVDARRYEEAQAAAAKLPEDAPLRHLVLAYLAAAEGRYADAETLLPEPRPDPEYPAETVFIHLIRLQALRARGDLTGAHRALNEAVSATARCAQSWLRIRVEINRIEMMQGGADIPAIVAALGGTAAEAMRALTRFWGRMGEEENRAAQKYVDRVLQLAELQALPATALESVARERLAQAQGAKRALAHLLLAIAELSQGRMDDARQALDQAADEADGDLEPYVFWGWSLVMRAQNDLGQALDYGLQAVDCAMAREEFPDLEPLFVHNTLLVEEAEDADGAARAAYLRQRLAALAGPPAWVSALLARLASAATPPR